MKLNKIVEDWNNANSLFKWCFGFVVIQKFCYHGNVTVVTTSPLYWLLIFVFHLPLVVSTTRRTRRLRSFLPKEKRQRIEFNRNGFDTQQMQYASSPSAMSFNTRYKDLISRKPPSIGHSANNVLPANGQRPASYMARNYERTNDVTNHPEVSTTGKLLSNNVQGSREIKLSQVVEGHRAEDKVEEAGTFKVV